MPGTIVEAEQILYGAQPRTTGAGRVEELACADTDSLRLYLRKQAKLRNLAFDLNDLYLGDLLPGEPLSDEMLQRVGDPELDPEYFSAATRLKIITDIIAEAGTDLYGVVLKVLYRHLCQWVITGDQDHKQLIIRQISSVHNYAALGELARRVHALTNDR